MPRKRYFRSTGLSQEQLRSLAAGVAAKQMTRTIEAENSPKEKWPVTKEDYQARVEAMRECAEHLRQCWTDNPKEREQGNWLSEQLEIWAKKIEESNYGTH